jgi:hypothetical protein
MERTTEREERWQVTEPGAEAGEGSPSGSWPHEGASGLSDGEALDAGE